jgi:spermidine synthase
VVIFLLTALGSTSLYSVFLPNLVGESEQNMRRYYAAEVVGSLAGILLLPVLARVDMVLVEAAYLVSLLSIARIVGVRGAVFGAMAALSVAFLVAAAPADRAVSAAIYRDEIGDGAPVRILFTRYSPYHKIEVAESAQGERMLLLDGQIHFEPSDHEGYSYFVAEYPAHLLGRPTVSIAGCGSMSTVGRIGNEARSIEIVDLDPDVFDTSRAWFARYNRLGELQNWSFQADDAKHFFATTDHSFDLVVDDIPPAKTRQVALTYTREFFALVRARLTARGIFSLPSLVSVHAVRRDYGRRILATLAGVFDRVFVLTVHGSSYCFATGSELPLDEPRLRAAIDHPYRDAVRIVLPDEVRRMTEGTAPITIDNMADLIEK